MRYIKLRSRAFVQLVAFFVSILILPIMVLGGYYLGYLNRTERENYAASVRSSAEAFSVLIDSEFNKVQKIASDLGKEAWVKKMAVDSSVYDNEFTVLRKIELRNNLANCEFNSALLPYFAVIFPKRGIVASSWGWCSIADFKRNILVSDSEACKDRLLEAANGSHYFQLYPDIRLRTFKSRDPAVPVVHSLEMLDSPRASAVFFLDFDNLKPILESSDLNMMKISIFMGKDTLYTCDMPSSGKIGAPGELAMPSAIPGLTYRFQYKPWTSTNLSAKVEIFTVVVFMLLLAGLLISIRLASVSVKPLYALLSKVLSDRRVSFARVNEYRFLAEEMDNLTQQNDIMKNAIIDYRNVIRQQTIRILLADPVSARLDTFSEINLDYRDTDYFSVVVVCESECGSDSRTPGGDAEIARAPEPDVFSDLLCGLEINYFQVLEQINGNTVVILCFRDYSMSQIEETAAAACRRIDGAAAPWNRAAAGPVEKGIAGIGRSYRIALEKQNLIAIMRKSGSKAAQYYFPTDLETRMVNSLKNGDSAAAFRLVKEIEDENAGRNLPIETASKLISLLLGDGQRVLAEEKLEAEIPEIADMGSDSRFLIHAFAVITLFYGEICNNVNIHRARSPHIEFYKRLLKYVNDNITNPDLTLKLLATQYHISDSFISKVFKEINTWHFYDYVSRRRIDISKQLMLEGICSITSLAKMTGYDSDYTFRRVFKRYEGVTPSEYIKYRLTDTAT